MDLSAIRQEYTKHGLHRKDLPKDPMLFFGRWLGEAIEKQEPEPTAMIVATVSESGQPSTRTVLLKGIHEGKFIFYTNYESRKGKQLAQNPDISLTFLWHGLQRQVHIEGTAVKTSDAESDTYFHSRPEQSQVATRISPQSEAIPGRLFLMKNFITETALWTGREISRPDFWGGYAVTPHQIEFWQGRSNRLHDRFLYEFRPDGQWHIERLAP
ncbi:MAG: pyridoxamine 5'-phosphate oxidase [Bacteroides sp.]|nr:pyridoxamine 5'-phosphate oxidase [Bacteroides sp.]